MAVNVAIVRQGARTTTGTQDFTKSGFGTCKAAIFFLSSATANDTQTADRMSGAGACDGTNQFNVSIAAVDGGSWEADRHGMTDETIAIMTGGGGIDGEANFDSFITDGVRINWANAPAAAVLVTCLLFGGDDLSVQAGTVDVTTSNQTVTTNFQSDLIFFWGNGIQLDDTSSFSAPQNYGFAARVGAGVNNAAIGWTANDGEDLVYQGIWSDKCAANHSADEFSRGFECTAITSTNFTLTHRAGNHTASLASGYLALSFGGVNKAWVGNIDSPTATGNNPWTGVGFKPQMVGIIGGLGQNVDTGTGASIAVETGASAGALSVGLFDGTDEFVTGWQDQDDQVSAYSKSISKNISMLVMDDGASTKAHEATFTSFDSDGWTLNFSDADGTVRKWIAFAIEEDSGVTLEQEGFRFRNDDGSESGASWRYPQDENAKITKGENVRLRTLINATGDPASTQYQLEYRKVGDTTWKKVDVEPG